MESLPRRARIASLCVIVAVLPAFPACTNYSANINCVGAAIVDGERVAVLEGTRYRSSWMGEPPVTVLSNDFTIVRHRLNAPAESLVTMWASELALAERKGTQDVAVVGGTGTIIEAYDQGEMRYVRHFDPETQRYTGPPIDVTQVDPGVGISTLEYPAWTRSRRYLFTHERLIDVVRGRDVEDVDVRRMIRQAREVYGPAQGRLLITDDLAWAVVVPYPGTPGEFIIGAQRYSRSDAGVAFSSRGRAPHVVPTKSDGLRLLTVESVDGVLHSIHGESEYGEHPYAIRARLQIVDTKSGVVRAQQTLDGVSAFHCLLWDYRQKPVILPLEFGPKESPYHEDIVVWDYGRDEVRHLIIDPRDMAVEEPR